MLNILTHYIFHTLKIYHHFCWITSLSYMLMYIKTSMSLWTERPLSSQGLVRIGAPSSSPSSMNLSFLTSRDMPLSARCFSSSPTCFQSLSMLSEWDGSSLTILLCFIEHESSNLCLFVNKPPFIHTLLFLWIHLTQIEHHFFFIHSSFYLLQVNFMAALCIAFRMCQVFNG